MRGLTALLKRFVRNLGTGYVCFAKLWECDAFSRRFAEPNYAVALPSPAPNWIPCAKGSSVEKLIVFVWRRM